MGLTRLARGLAGSARGQCIAPLIGPLAGPDRL